MRKSPGLEPQRKPYNFEINLKEGYVFPLPLWHISDKVHQSLCFGPLMVLSVIRLCLWEILRIKMSHLFDVIDVTSVS